MSHQTFLIVISYYIWVTFNCWLTVLILINYF